MKVVINKCFGGFSLSPKAVQRIAELKGRECYFFVQDIHAGLRSPYIPTDIAGANDAMVFWAFSVPNPNEVLRDQKEWANMTQGERQAQNARYTELEISNRDYERHDPDLVKTVEELGEQASGSHAKLEVVEIPDGVEYIIEEHDGNEHVAEAHRTWR